MLPIGKICQLVAERRTDSGFYLSDGRNHRETVLLPNKFVPPDLEPGNEIEVFLLRDSEVFLCQIFQSTDRQCKIIFFTRVAEYIKMILDRYIIDL